MCLIDVAKSVRRICDLLHYSVELFVEIVFQGQRVNLNGLLNFIKPQGGLTENFCGDVGEVVFSEKNVNEREGVCTKIRK